MLRLKLFVAGLLVATIVPGVGVTAAGQGLWLNSGLNFQSDKKSEKVDVKAKELPKEIKIPEVRTDKVLLFQEQGRNVQLEQQAAIDRFRASEEWKALEARQKLVLDKLETELRSALSLAGVKEEDFAKYKYDQATLKFTLQAEPKAEPKK
jgi:hypothetical protein